MGMIYKRGDTWWIKYYRNGKAFRESSQSDKKMVAKKLLDKREGAIAQGKTPGLQFEKVTFDELSDAFLQDYKINEKKSLVRAERSANHLSAFFKGYKAQNITTPVINSYVLSRLEEDVSNATINRELSALKRMLNLGAKQTPPIVDRVPHIPMLKENNTRKGFFEHDEFLALRDALPSHIKGVVSFAYKTGWRISEISSLTWSQVDRKQGIVRLEVGETKNNEARTYYLDSELKTIVESQWINRTSLSPYVFLNKSGDDRIKRFDKVWKKACQEAKIGLKHFHDFRRTAVRNMVRSGVPERVAMMISGHKTRSIFDRYNIVNDTDLKLATIQQENYLKSLTGTVSGTIHQIDSKRKAVSS